MNPASLLDTDDAGRSAMGMSDALGRCNPASLLDTDDADDPDDDLHPHSKNTKLFADLDPPIRAVRDRHYGAHLLERRDEPTQLIREDVGLFGPFSLSAGVLIHPCSEGSQ
jgi:hypothetical protein